MPPSRPEPSFADWLLGEETAEQMDGDGDCPGCLDGMLDELWEVDKLGNSFAVLQCRNCGWHD